ncbi:MAG TPA: DUF4375 domain-containing protein [Aestuariivirgaceae bacterium]|nr:DUF4375 domain-containing protein [Aestuariivirgaceae bacterium]
MASNPRESQEPPSVPSCAPKYPQPIAREWIDATPNIDLPRLLWDYLLTWFDAHRSEANPLELPMGLRVVYFYTVFDGDVLNGGIVQFFQNNTPREVEETRRLLRLIGAKDSAEVLTKAIDVFVRKYDWPAHSDKRWRCYEAYNDADIEALTRMRCDDESSGRDYELVAAYCRSHPEEFSIQMG